MKHSILENGETNIIDGVKSVKSSLLIITILFCFCCGKRLKYKNRHCVNNSKKKKPKRNYIKQKVWRDNNNNGNERSI